MKGPPADVSYWFRIMQTRWALPDTPDCVIQSPPRRAKHILTVDFVVNEPFTRVELASRLSIHQVLTSVS
jgi:hypothetical protein